MVSVFHIDSNKKNVEKKMTQIYEKYNEKRKPIQKQLKQNRVNMTDQKASK